MSITQPDLERQDPTETEDYSSITLRGIIRIIIELYSYREKCVNLFCFLMAGNPEMQKHVYFIHIYSRISLL